MMSGRYHAAAPLFHSVPDWLRFPERRRLIDVGTRKKAGTIPKSEGTQPTQLASSRRLRGSRLAARLRRPVDEVLAHLDRARLGQD